MTSLNDGADDIMPMLCYFDCSPFDSSNLKNVGSEEFACSGLFAHTLSLSDQAGNQAFTHPYSDYLNYLIGLWRFFGIKGSLQI